MPHPDERDGWIDHFPAHSTWLKLLGRAKHALGRFPAKHSAKIGSQGLYLHSLIPSYETIRPLKSLFYSP